MNTKHFITLMKREWWENKAQFIRSTLVMLAIVSVITSVGLGYVHFKPVNVTGWSPDPTQSNCLNDGSCSIENDKVRVHLDVYLRQDLKRVGNSLEQFLYMNCMMFSISLAIMMLVYGLKSLYEDRVKKDILFWRSLPFTETENVAAKMATLLLSLPVVVFVSNLLTLVIGILLSVIWCSIFGLHFMEIMQGINFGHSLYIILAILRDNLVGMVTLLPVLGYMLACSAWAKRAPGVPAFILPIGLAILSATISYVFGKDVLVAPLFSWYGNFLKQTHATFMLYEPLNFTSDMLLPLLMSIAIGVGFMAAAIWLRNHRYEI